MLCCSVLNPEILQICDPPDIKEANMLLVKSCGSSKFAVLIKVPTVRKTKH